MERITFAATDLRYAFEKGDTDGILLSLMKIKNCLRSPKNVVDVDEKTFKILIDLIKSPNPKIMDSSISILANCCVRNSHRDMFKDMGGIPHLMLIIKTIENDSILGRAYRLLGNLASNRSLAVVLNEHNAGQILLKSLETLDNKSSATLTMILRAVKKLWAAEKYRSKMLSEDVTTNLSYCLNSMDDKVVGLSIETLTSFSTINASPSRNIFKVTKELLSKLVELYKKEEMTHLTVKCLSSLICHQTSQVWKYLEGSELPEVFINYIQQMNFVSRGVLEALYKLCTEGAVRSKVKSSGLLPILLKLCSESNIDRILPIFYLFQYDISSIALLAQDKKFISLLTRNITKDGAVRLLSVVSRLQPPVTELLKEENLNVIIQNKECHGILRKMSQTQIFLSHLIVTGRIWEISNANCLSEHQEQYTESLLVHLLRTGERHERENAALAVPFLIKCRHFTMFNALAHNDGITIILRLLKERTLEERILASVVKLISIFQESFNGYHKHSKGFFDSSRGKSQIIHHISVDESKKCSETDLPLREKSKPSDEIPVTFEMDCGSLVTVDRNLLCRNSPVVDAMLNGDFMESNQQKVKLSCCSPEAIISLEKILKNEASTTDIDVETHLELISLTDRFLMSNLNYLLTVTLPVDETSCVAVLQWCRNSGHVENKVLIQERVYEFVFSSSSHLLLAMKNDNLRTSLVEEITSYLTKTLKELL